MEMLMLATGAVCLLTVLVTLKRNDSAGVPTRLSCLGPVALFGAALVAIAAFLMFT